MSELNGIIISKLEKVEVEISGIKLDITENTKDLKYHIKRTDDLQEIVEDLNKIIDPLHQDYIAKKAIEEFKKVQREDYLFKLRLPGIIVAAVVAITSILTWLGSK